MLLCVLGENSIAHVERRTPSSFPLHILRDFAVFAFLLLLS